MPADSETSRKLTRGTSAGQQAAEKAAEKAEREAARLEQQQVKSSGGYRGSTPTNRPRSNQHDNASAQAGLLGNPVKEELDKGGDRASSPKKLVQGTRQRAKVDTSASTGEAKGQSPVGTPQQAASAQATGAETMSRSSGNIAANPTATGKASGETGDADVTRDIVDPSKPTTKPLNTSLVGCKPVSGGSGAPVLLTTDPGARMFSQAFKSSTASVQAERSAQADRQKTQVAVEARERALAEVGNTGEGGNYSAPPGVVRSEEHDPNAQPSGPPRPLPDNPTSRSNSLNSVPAEGVEFQEQNPGDRDTVELSDNDSNDYFDDDNIYEDAREFEGKAALLKEALTQEEYEALCHHRLQRQQEANRQMYLQQQQLLDVAHAVAPKPQGSRSTSTMLGIGGSSDKQTTKEKYLRKKLAEMEYALRQSQSSYSNLDHHYRKTWNRANAQSDELQRSQHQVHRLLEDNRSLNHELEAVKVQLADAKTLSEVRGKELKGSQVFLTKADTLSTTDVVQKVSALNEEIFQAAALLGEMLQNTERTDGTQDQATAAFEKARWMLGERMAGILAAESTNVRTDLNPLLVQIVLQIAITTWCKFVVSSWKPSDPAVADFLSVIYTEIRRLEDQAVAGRWRSITRAQLRSSSDDWTENLMNALLSVLFIAGWSTREPDQQHQFVRRLPPIFKAVQDLRKALGEDVTSMDMEVAIIEAGDVFNSAYMEDGYGDARASSGSGKKAEKVSGTTGLGLHKITMKRTQEGPISQAEIVLFPKVALEGTLKEAMDPAPPPASRLRKRPKHAESKSGGSSNGGGGGGGGAPAAGGGTSVVGMLQSAGSAVASIIIP